MAIAGFAPSITIYEMFESKFARPWPLEWFKVKCKYSNINATQDFLFDDNSNVCSLIIYAIFYWNKMPTLWPWNDDQGQGEKWDLRRSSGNVRFYINDFVPNFGYKETCLCKGNMHTGRDRVLIIGKNVHAKQICLKIHVLSMLKTISIVWNTVFKKSVRFWEMNTVNSSAECWPLKYPCPFEK